ncbi:putative group XV phospholipase A2-like [Apostichopus japonicus]|uniref:Putative group XV phospholipase A2-like n=1 Tax=Stichopus japonicus TaxID=307972 RepID=A0A2G8LNG5_STIJA|nr:putative group XV phospholipase A2-like [Apostichopus japonicus]
MKLLVCVSFFVATLSFVAGDEPNLFDAFHRPKLNNSSESYKGVNNVSSSSAKHTTLDKAFLQRQDALLFTKVVGYPAVLLPGDGGNQLLAVLNRSEAAHIYCSKSADAFTLWLDLEELLPLAINCFTDNIRLIYDPKTKKSSSPDGVNITVPGFGGTESVEWIDPSHLPFGEYFVGLVNAMVERGYKRGVSIRGAPFDFRMAPNTENAYFSQLKTLIEETYTLNNQRKVVIITHSLGGLFGLYFLNHMEQSWKEKYVQAYAPIASPFAGAAKVMRLFASGDNLDEKVINPLVVRPAQRTYPSSAFLMPSDTYWSANEVLIITPKKNYTVSDFDEFFTDIQFETGKLLRNDTKDLVHDLVAPGVPVFHVHGKNMPTPERFIYDEIFQFPDDQPHVHYGAGDGTVNMRSLKSFLKWKNEQPQQVEEYEIDKGEHLSILQMPQLHQYLLQNVLIPH